MTTISNLANRDLDPTSDDEVRRLCKKSQFLMLRRTVVGRHFLSLTLKSLSQGILGYFGHVPKLKET